MAKKTKKDQSSGLTPGVVEEATLNWTDLTGAKTGASQRGSNKFYKAQILEDGSGYKIIFNYGRVGQTGQTQVAYAATLDAAKKTFNKKINAKIKKGYHRLEMRTEKDEIEKAKEKGVKLDKKKPKKKKASRSFHKEVEFLLRLMYTSTGKAIKAGLSSSAGSSDSAPLGNLHDSQLDKGAEILEEIEELIQKKKGSKQKYIDLTNMFLSEIPRNIDYAVKRGKLDIDSILLNTEERIQKQREFITLLRDAHLQKEVFAEAAVSDDPVEVWYDGLKCNISYIEKNTKEFKEISRYFDKGQSPNNSNFYNKLEVKRAWVLERNGKRENFDKYSKMVFDKKDPVGLIHGWHGTRTENLMGISKSGLLMPENLPKGVHISGKAFGMGIYHAPCWPDAGEDRKADDGKVYKRFNGALKSMNYTSISGAYWASGNRDRIGYMFLEEIALGVPEVHLTACWGKKRPAKGLDHIYARAFGNPQLAHDEIVTFDEDASMLTHLLEIGFKK